VTAPARRWTAQAETALRVPGAAATSTGMKNRNARRLALGLLLACATACTGADPSPAGNAVSSAKTVARAGLVCVLTAPASVQLPEPVVPVGFTLRNDSSVAITVLRRQTPLEGILGDLFEVTVEGRRLEYRGKMVKRGSPTADEFVTIDPGLHAHATIDLAEGYDLASPGRYRVRFVRHDEFACNELTIARH
jgi:peptidyl-Lys metalloendopeptidase